MYSDGSWQEHAVPAALAGSPHMCDTDKKVHIILLYSPDVITQLHGEPGRNSSVTFRSKEFLKLCIPAGKFRFVHDVFSKSQNAMCVLHNSFCDYFTLFKSLASRRSVFLVYSLAP